MSAAVDQRVKEANILAREKKHKHVDYTLPFLCSNVPYFPVKYARPIDFFRSHGHYMLPLWILGTVCFCVDNLDRPRCSTSKQRLSKSWRLARAHRFQRPGLRAEWPFLARTKASKIIQKFIQQTCQLVTFTYKKSCCQQAACPYLIYSWNYV